MSIGIIAASYADAGSAVTGQTLTVPAGKVASDMTDFVTRVDLSQMSTAWWAAANADGSNIRVRKDGSLVPADLVGPAFSKTNKTGVLYFKANLATASDNLFAVEVGSETLAPAVDDPIGRNAVWASYHAVVDWWELVDRTGISGHSVLLEGSATIHDGVLDCGSRVGNGRISNVGTLGNWFAGATVVSLAGGSATNRGLLSYSSETSGGTTANNSRQSLALRSTNLWGIWNSQNSWLMSAVGQVAGRFHMKQTNATTRTVYRNGASIVSGASLQRPVASGVMGLFVGSDEPTHAERFAGTIARTYLRNGAVSDAWLAAETLSWETPASFYTIT